MTTINPNTLPFADKLRARVCGICIQDNKLLLVRHQATINNQAFWAPPGGGVQYGETLHDCLKREILEETGLQVTIKRFLCVNEFLQKPLHAVELFFEVSIDSGNLRTGSDPESAPDKQLIEQVQFLSVQEIKNIPNADKHSLLHHLISLDDLLGMEHHFLQ
ncbi:NUDIX domain-containing protein [Pontibacter vulgaris]|uniref:NUDIX domain-containing protein n=1 Tax=Pontibacter vulgaris TaxID=2905679 RepID=UPI001FA7C001|nr:NUDIX hydrolase [Pontibacter vulgaris]